MTDPSKPTPQTARFDRMCAYLEHAASNPARVKPEMQRGDLNLAKDGAQHRRYHTLYEDLQN